MTRPSLGEFRHVIPIATRWSDLDAIGHVNNARYFSYDEQARIDYFRSRLGTQAGQRSGRGFILARIACDFIEQIHHPSDLQIGLRIHRIGQTSLETRGAIFIGERCMAATQGVVVWFDHQAQQKMRVPDDVRAAIHDFEIVKPAP